MPDIKLGSLFDGIGVFPLAASRCGIRPVWASEIEKAPISITKRHFPDMVHLGDITKVDGGKIPPVHIITFGSPCQNLSLIGNRSGLAGAKSSLFYQAFRIIQEMRDATDNLYPAIAVWENVMGAFSTNDRMDFRAVLSAFSDTEVPMPPSGRYSFDIALQNEFSLEENIALARQFLLENFVSRGMVVDFAVHQPDREDGGIPNPHFHVLCPIRPIEQNGKWGLKQRRVYELDEDGNRIRDQNGEYVFNAVPTTDWGSPETLEYWRQTWAELCNGKFAEKGLDVRIDHRSYERQGVELLPTVHEGATVRAMEKKGIRTEKGEFNRWIKATNAVIRDIKKKIALLFDWIAEAKAELAKPQAPDLVSLLNAYYTQRRAGAYSQKGKVSNLKEMNETFNYLRANGIYTLEDLESRVSEHSAATESLKKTLDEQTARMKAIKQLYDSSAAFQSLKPVYDGLQKIKFEKPRAKYKAEHEAELKQFYAARRKLTGEFPDGKVDMKKLTEEYDELEQAHNTTYGEFKTVRDDLHRLWKVKSCVGTAARFNERTEEQKLQNRPQTRQKKEELSR